MTEAIQLLKIELQPIIDAFKQVAERLTEWATTCCYTEKGNIEKRNIERKICKARRRITINNEKVIPHKIFWFFSHRRNN